MTQQELEAILDKYFTLSSQYRDGMENISRFDSEEIANVLNRIEKRFEKPMQKERDKKTSLEEQKRNETDPDKIQKLNDKIQKCNEKLQDYSDALVEAKKRQNEAIGASAKNEIFTKLSKGWNQKVNNFGGQVSNFGNAFNRLGKGKNGVMGVLGKFGGVVGKVGGLLSKFAGPIGMVISLGKDILDFKNKLKESENLEKEQEYAVRGEQLKIRNTQQKALNEVKISNQQNEANKQSIAIQYAQSAQSAQIQFAQSIASEYAKLSSEGIRIGTEGYAQAHEMAASAPFDIKGAAYSAANAAIDFAGRYEMFKENQSLAKSKVGLAQSNLSAQLGAAATTRDAAIENANAKTKLANIVTMVGAKEEVNQQKLDNSVNQLQRDYASHQMSKEVSGSIPVVGGLVKGGRDFGDYVTGYEQNYRGQVIDAKGIAEINSIDKDYRMDILRTQTAIVSSQLDMAMEARTAQANMHAQAVQAQNALQQTRLEAIQQEKQAYIDAAKQIAKAWMNMTQKLNDEFLKMEDASTKLGRGMGYFGDQLQDFNAAMANMRKVVAPFGKDTEWIQKQQSSYQETTGRNVQFSEQDMRMAAGTSVLLGDELTTELNNGMEIFNHSIADGDAMILQMYKNVSKMGLNGKKYAKDLANNLKLAEKYNFKNGVKSLMEMSKWAQNMRFNVSSLDGTLDDIQKGGLEGIVTKAAKLQVLGGSYAMGSDPMAMAYESFMDPEALAKRFNSMIENEGVLNSKTGEIDFGIASQMRMREFAEATGQDIKDVKNQARQHAKIKKMQGILSEDLNEDQISMIANKARYKDGKWVVTDALGDNEMNVADINSQNISQLGSMIDEEDPQKAMVQIQTDLLSLIQESFSKQEEYRNEEQAIRADLIQNQWPTLIQTNREIVTKMAEEYKINREKYLHNFNENLGTLSRTFDGFWENFNRGNSDIDGRLSSILTSTNQISETLVKCFNEGKKALEKISGISIAEMSMPENINESKRNKDDKQVSKTKTEKRWEKVEEEYRRKEGYFGNFDKGQDLSTARAKYYSSLGDDKYENGDYLGYAWNKLNAFGEQTLGRANQAIGNAFGIDASAIDSWFHFNDGFISQNGTVAKIDSNDQVLAAKNGGPIDKMIDTYRDSISLMSNGISEDIRTLNPFIKLEQMKKSDILPTPMPYDSQVKENPYRTSQTDGGNGKMEIAPIQININGSIQLNGANGTSDLTQQLANDPNFIRSLSQIISMEVEKKVQGGRVVNPVNRNLLY